MCIRDRCVWSGAWTPTVHLFSHAQGKLNFDEEIGAFVPGEQLGSVQVAGSANGSMSLGACLQQGYEAGSISSMNSGHKSEQQAKIPQVDDSPETPMQLLWQVPKTRRSGAKRFVDIQNDVTVEDIELAFSEGYVSVEHLKRYTTLGMGTDQGRTSNINGLANLARLRETDIPSVGHTTFRPPYTPVSYTHLTLPTKA